MPSPTISIITPAFDVAAFVGDAVGSAIAQNFTDWEMIVIDDGSGDGTAAAAEAAARQDKRVRVLRQRNAGVASARMAGLDVARGTALLFLDADDWLAQDALGRLSRCLAGQPDAVAAYGPWASVAEDARSGAPALRLKAGPFPTGDVVEHFVVQNLLANGGHLLARRGAFEAAGGFTPGLRYGEDWECWIRLALQGPFAAVSGQAPLCYVRERAGSAYRRMASDPAAFDPAMQAIWGNPALRERLCGNYDRLRARAEAENAWVVGKELIRHGATAEGLRKLRHALALAPGLKRAAFLAAAHALPLLPKRLHGPLARYPT